MPSGYPKFTYGAIHRYQPFRDVPSRIGQAMISARGPMPFTNFSKADIVGGYVAPRAVVGAAQFANRKTRQKYFLGEGYMLRNYNKQSHRKYKRSSKGAPTNRKNVSNQKRRNPRGYGKHLFKKATKADIAALGNQVRSINKAIKRDLSTHIHRACTADRLLTGSPGIAGNVAVDVVSAASLQLYMANLRYYDPATPGTLVTANPAVPTFSHDVVFKNIYSKVEFRNNYQVPCDIKVYLAKCKHDTNDPLLTTYAAGITDQVNSSGSPSATSMLLYYSDIERVTEQWDLDCVIDKRLEPGQEAECSHSTGEFSFDPSHYDSDTTAYQKQFKAFQWVVRLTGVLGHDTAQDEQTTLNAGVDYQYMTKVEIHYDAGINLNDIFIDENRATSFTTGGVVSLKPLADNLPYTGA